MTDIKSAIDTLKTMYPKKCKMVDGRLTGGYDDYESEKGQAITSAIRSLQAWSKVLQELEDMREIIWKDTNNDARIVRANAWDKIETLNKAIDIINQKLAEIEEVR